MSSLVLAVVQSDPQSDPRPALAAVPAGQCYLLRPAELAATPVPTSVRALVAAYRGRVETAAAVRRDSAADAVVVLEAGETVSPELAAALVDLRRPSEPAAAYGARRVRRFLGREIDGGTVVMAWQGDPVVAPAPQLLPGVLIKTEPDIATMIATLEAAATRAAAERSAVGLADFVTGPAAALGRCLVARRRDGVPGVILAILEAYGEVLEAAKVWERETAAARRRTRPSKRRVPPGFVSVETHTGWAVVRAGMAEQLLPLLLQASPESVAGEPLLQGGRGATWAIAIGDGARAVLRWYRRGGAVRHVIRDRYFGWRSRPIVELGLTEEARRRGVAAVEVLGARVDRLAAGFYRGAIMTREAEDTETLAAALRRPMSDAERAAVLTAVARTLRAMHDRGVHHRDVNAGNILVRCRGAAVAVHLIDFDRACLRRRVPVRARRRALGRLERSLAKLGATGGATLAADHAVLESAYWGTP